MRIVVKGADFSAVSIGKVVEDLSFAFNADDGVAAINSFFPNYNSGNFTPTTIYLGTSGGTVTEDANNSGRAVSDYIEVSEGMKIDLYALGAPLNTPSIVAFDSNKTILSAKCVWNDQDPLAYTYIVPSGVKYLKFQSNNIVTTSQYRNTEIIGSMPEI